MELIHGYGETGDMWAPLAANLMRDHTVIVRDLRGLGLSSKPRSGFDEKNEDEASRQLYANFYALVGAMHSGFEQFHAFDQDSIDNRAMLAAGVAIVLPTLRAISRRHIRLA